MRAWPPGLINANDVDQAIAWLNGQHALVYDGAKTLIWTMTTDRTLGRRVWKQSSVSDFRTYYAAYLVPNGRRPQSLADAWLQHPDSRRYREVVFDPSGEPDPDVLNLWRGFAVTPSPGSWDRLQNHLYEVVAGENAGIYDYLVGWMARMVQKPSEPAGTAIVLRGRPGAGKGILVRALGKLLGEHFIHISHTGQLTSRFNGLLADALLVFADEAVWAGDRQGEGALKALITEPTLAIERKGREITTVRNVVHLLMASNQEWVAPVGIGDRRFCVLDVADGRVGDHSYFSALAHEQANGGAPAMLYDLLGHDLSEYRSQDLPETGARRDQMTASLEPLQRWWIDVLMTTTLADTSFTSDGLTIERSKLYDHYLQTMTKWRVSHPVNQVWLGRQLQTLAPGVKSLRTTMNVRCYVFPSLIECRLRFESHMGTRITWPDDDD